MTNLDLLLWLYLYNPTGFQLLASTGTWKKGNHWQLCVKIFLDCLFDTSTKLTVRMCSHPSEDMLKTRYRTWWKSSWWLMFVFHHFVALKVFGPEHHGTVSVIIWTATNHEGRLATHGLTFCALIGETYRKLQRLVQGTDHPSIYVQPLIRSQVVRAAA